MSNTTPFVPLAAVLMIASSIGAGFTGYEYQKNTQADAFYLTETSDLRSSGLQAIYLSERAATDSNFVPELEKLESSVEVLFQRIQDGDPARGIPPAPVALQAQANTLREAWDPISASMAKIIASKNSTESFSRARLETRNAMAASLADAEAGLARFQEVGGDTSQKKILQDAVESLREASTIIGRDSADTETMRAAESAISSFLGAVSSISRSLPKDKQLFDSLAKSYRGAQATQRLNVKLIETSSGALGNLPHARAVWVERDRFSAASTTLVETAKSQASTRVITPLIVGALGAMAVLLALITSFVAQRAASTRAQAVESRGNTIIGSQKERSKELTLLLNDINEFGSGAIDHHVVDDKNSTKDIAQVLNHVFGKIREIISEADQTITGLAAASEQTLKTAQNVIRNRGEQSSALEHISGLISEMSSYVTLIQEVTNNTQNVTIEVSNKVRTGSTSVTDVHEGILLLAEHNLGIQHRSKNMIESFQSLERISHVVSQVAERSDLVAWNAHLVADQIEGNEEVTRAMNKAAEAIQVLATQCKQAVGEIDALLKNMNEAARDNQYAVDSSQREIDGLLTRSGIAQSALSDISEMTNSLSESVEEVTSRTDSLKSQSAEVSTTLGAVLNYSAENSAASEQTAHAISNVNRSAQELQRVIQRFMGSN